MRTSAAVGVLVVMSLWSGVATADPVAREEGAQARGADAGAERVLSKLRIVPGLGQWRDGGRPGEPRLTIPGDETRTLDSPAVVEDIPRAFEIVTTRRLGTPASVVRDRGTFTLLWEAQVRLRGGRPWGLEFTSIREAEAFDRTSVGPWPF
jgi:hypothetical protein